MTWIPCSTLYRSECSPDPALYLSKRVKVTYEDILPVIVTLDDAIKHKSYLDAPIIGHTVGEVEKSMKEDEHILESEARMGGQEHFYFETNAILCSPIGK